MTRLLSSIGVSVMDYIRRFPRCSFSMMSTASPSKLIASAILSLAVLFQLTVLQKQFRKTLISIQQHSNRSSQDRSALLLAGEDFAGYIDFLSETIPADGKVILPPSQPAQLMSNTALMRFYLRPRELHNCGINEVEECIQRMTGSNSYIITAWKFPPHELALQLKDFIVFQDGRGVYVPPETIND